MAKPIVVTHSGEIISFAPSRVDRSKIYGSRKRIVVDGSGRICTKAALTADGSQLLMSGMTAQGYFTSDGHWVARNDMVGLDFEGHRVEPKPSTLGVPQKLEGPVDPTEVLDLAIDSVFFLEPEQAAGALLAKLKSGELYKCPFNYASGLEAGTAYLLANDEGVFALVGKPVVTSWVEEGEVFVPPAAEDQADDLDFETL